MSVGSPKVNPPSLPSVQQSPFLIPCALGLISLKNKISINKISVIDGWTNQQNNQHTLINSSVIRNLFVQFFNIEEIYVLSI